MLTRTHHTHTCGPGSTQTRRIMLEPAATQTKALQQHTRTRKHAHTHKWLGYTLNTQEKDTAGVLRICT